jgi:hypothetical protein
MRYAHSVSPLSAVRNSSSSLARHTVYYQIPCVRTGRGIATQHTIDWLMLTCFARTEPARRLRQERQEDGE